MSWPVRILKRVAFHAAKMLHIVGDQNSVYIALALFVAYAALLIYGPTPVSIRADTPGLRKMKVAEVVNKAAKGV